MAFAASDLSIVVPTRHRWETLELTLSALAAQTVSGFEVVVVADGMDQKLPPVLTGAPHVLQQEHAGPGVARNLGVAETSRPLVLFIGDDMIPRPEFVERHLARHVDARTDEVAVLGRIVWHRDVPQDRLHSWLEWSTALFDYRLLEEQDHDDAYWTRFYSSNVSMKRRLFEAVGGFDPDFEFDYEDLDFGYRAGERGMRLLYEREAVVEHRHPYDWPALVRRYESHAAAERVMMTKHSWFKPWFHDQIARAEREPRASRVWPLVVDLVPRRQARIRRAIERRADRWYLQQLAPAFRAAWQAAAPGVTDRTGTSNAV